MDSIGFPRPTTGFTEPQCPVSRSRAIVGLCEVDGYRVWRCPDSATDFVWPAPTDDELKRYYDRSAWFEGGERGGYANYDAQTAASLPMVAKLLDEFPNDGTVRYVLDVGCGYGNHLRLAADRGWKAFGVELSDHARQVAAGRHGDVMMLVAEVEELVPHQFDLVLMLDVLEHVADPYALLFRLFNRGLIARHTRLVVTTPNARCVDAVSDPSRWAFRHPPSHLVYYSARSLRRLMQNLLFDEVQVRGTSPMRQVGASVYPDEALRADEALANDAGLLCEASGSRFFEFMQERYVPGTWSRLAEYEHIPRYQFAQRFVAGKSVLDFGCGTGYGSRLLADTAAGVVALDIDQAALDWAARWHDTTRLGFVRRDDLGAGLPAATFDVVTCFEMIEHVDHAMQIDAIRNIARVLKPDGKLIISTPNPTVTAAYGDNPYHLREMDEATFRALLEPCFTYVTIEHQWIRPSVAIGAFVEHGRSGVVFDFLPTPHFHGEPAAYIAICSQHPIAPNDLFLTLDASADFVLHELRRQQAETALRLHNFTLREEAVASAVSEAHHRHEYDKVRQQNIAKDRDLDHQAKSLESLERHRIAKERAFDEQRRQIALLRQAINDSHAVITTREKEAARLQALVAERDESLRDQARNLVALEKYQQEKEAILAEQNATIGRLTTYWTETEEALAEQAATIERLTTYWTETEEALAEQAVTIERLTTYWTETEKVLAEQAVTIERLTTYWTETEKVLAEQAVTIERLTAYWVEKEAVLRVQAATIEMLDRDRAGQDCRLVEQARTIASIEAREQEQQRAFAASVEIISELEQQRIEATARTASLRSELEAVIVEGERKRLELERGDYLRRGVRWLRRGAGRVVRSLTLERSASDARGRPVHTTFEHAPPVTAPDPVKGPAGEPGFAAYSVKSPAVVAEQRPRVLHALANFMTGGSSRLVVDLLERLGGDYEQRVVTSFIPSPPHYGNLTIAELPMGAPQDVFVDLMRSFAPDFVHIHYWGDCDEPWYRDVFAAAQTLNVPIVQNVNTPIAPYSSVPSARTIFVSEYVHEHFGHGAPNAEVIYPGSDFSHFERRADLLDNDCVGMVYRLEHDKLNASAIDVFILIAAGRPGVKCLIVGGGTLLEPFRERVRAAGCEASFEFTGYVSYESLPALYARMGIFIAPVWKESFGQVSSFAMNVGMPVIGYSVGAIPEIVADPSLVAPPGDADGLANIAIALLGDRPRRQAVIRANQERAAGLFSVEAMIERYRMLYGQMSTGR